MRGPEGCDDKPGAIGSVQAAIADGRVADGRFNCWRVGGHSSSREMGVEVSGQPMLLAKEAGAVSLGADLGGTCTCGSGRICSNRTARLIRSVLLGVSATTAEPGNVNHSLAASDTNRSRLPSSRQALTSIDIERPKRLRLTLLTSE